VDGAMEFYPLSFLGLRAGGESNQNDQAYRAYDCVTYNCLGRFERTYIRTELLLGAGPVFVQGVYQRERWTARHREARAFVEPTSGLALPASGDSQTVLRGVIGVKIGSSWSVAAGYNSVRADQVEGVSRFPFGLVRFNHADWTVGVGAGVFSSPLKDREAAALLTFEWVIRPSVALR